MKWKVVLIKYGLAVLFCAGAVWLELYLSDYSLMTESADKYRTLSNAFTIPGVFLVGVWCLAKISNTGFFDGIGYAMGHAIGMLIPGYKKRTETYADYKERKAEKRKENLRILFLLLVGIACLIVAVVFIFLFNSVYVE